MKIKPEEYIEEQGTVLEPDIYPAKLTGFGETEGQYGKRLVWQFDVADTEGEVVEAAAFSSYSMADGKKQSNLIKWTKALLGGEIPEDGVDLDNLKGLECRVDIDNYTKENGITKNKVTDVRSPKKAAKGKKKEAAKPAEVDVNEKDFEDIPF